MHNIKKKVKFTFLVAIALSVYVWFGLKPIKNSHHTDLSTSKHRISDLTINGNIIKIQSTLETKKVESKNVAAEILGLKLELDSNIDEDVEKYYTFSFRIHKTLREQLQILNKNPKSYDFNGLFLKAKKMSELANNENYKNIKKEVGVLYNFLNSTLSKQRGPEDFFDLRKNILILMAKMELIFESDKIRTFKKEKIKPFQNEIQSKIEYLRSGDCYSNKTLISVILYEPHGINCGFGCQMHSAVSGFICATDLNRLFLVKNYENGKYNKYFKFFDEKCKDMNYSSKYLEKIANISDAFSVVYNFRTYQVNNFQSCLSSDFLNKVRALTWIQEPFAWVHGQFFKYIFRETDYLKQYFDDYVKSIHLNLTLPFVGMNIRRGLKVALGTREANAYELKEYMKHAKDFYEKYFMKHPEKINIVPRTVFISTEEPNITRESLQDFPEYRFVFKESAVLKADEQLINKRNFSWDPLIGIIDLLILKRADLVLATHSSNFARLLFECMHGDDPDPYYKFISLDSYYFIYGYGDLFSKSNVI